MYFNDFLQKCMLNKSVWRIINDKILKCQSQGVASINSEDNRAFCFINLDFVTFTSQVKTSWTWKRTSDWPYSFLSSDWRKLWLGVMADVDPDTLLEWLQMGQGDERDMQLIALEQLCMLLLMSDNVDRCFETWVQVTHISYS